MTKTPGSLYAVMATAEMVTWTGLIIAMVARYGFGYEGELFFVAGLSHGIIFIAYCITAVVVVDRTCVPLPVVVTVTVNTDESGSPEALAVITCRSIVWPDAVAADRSICRPSTLTAW